MDNERPGLPFATWVLNEKFIATMRFERIVKVDDLTLHIFGNFLEIQLSHIAHCEDSC